MESTFLKNILSGIYCCFSEWYL